MKAALITLTLCIMTGIGGYAQNWTDSIFYSSIRPNEELRLGTLYIDTLEYIGYDDNYDDFLILVAKDAETHGSLICNDIHRIVSDLNLNSGDIIEIQWLIDSLRPEGDKELLWFREYAMEISKIKDFQEMPEVKEIKLSDSLSVRLRQITREEYETRKQASVHLRHKPYKVIKDLKKAQKMLGKRLKVFDMKEEGAESGWQEYEITFKDGTKEHLDADYSFIAYFPQLEILFFEGGHTSDQPFDLNNGSIAGSPYYHAVSPDKQWRINGYHTGQDCAVHFLEKWNKSKKKYEIIGWLYGYDNRLYNHYIFDFCFAGNWFWTSSNTAIFTNYGGTENEYFENTKFYEMEITGKTTIQ